MLITLDTLQPVRTEAARIEAEIAKQRSWLEVPSVVASNHWVDEINTKIAKLETQLAAVTR